MKPLKANLQDEETLRDLGAASVQIVHDLKNQLNGLKLYATFLRKRMEKSERASDELETIGKLIAGLERAATDMNALVRLGRPVEIKPLQRADLFKLLESACDGRKIERDGDGGACEGDFDASALTEALKGLEEGLRSYAEATTDEGKELRLSLRREKTKDGGEALIEWRGARSSEEGDVFKSFAGSAGLRLALAARIIRAHGGQVTHEADAVRVRLPLNESESK